MPLVYPLDLSANLSWDRPSPVHVAIYALDDPRDGRLRYIGKTADPSYRLYQHVQPAHLYGNTHRSKWVASLVAAGTQPVMRIMAWVLRDDWRDIECAYIAAARTAGHRLVNTADGGQGTNGLEATPEVRAKISATLQGHAVSAAARAKMSQASRERWARLTPDERAAAVEHARQANQRAVAALYAKRGWTQEQIEAYRQQRAAPKRPKAGYHLSDDHKARIGAGNRGLKRTPEQRASLSEAHKKPLEPSPLQLRLL